MYQGELLCYIRCSVYISLINMIGSEDIRALLTVTLSADI